MRNWQTLFPGGGSVWHSRQQWVRVSVSPESCSPSPVVVCLFYYYHPTGYEGVSYCGFHLHFFNGQVCPASPFLCSLASEILTAWSWSPIKQRFSKRGPLPLRIGTHQKRLHPPRSYQKCKSQALLQLTQTRNSGSGAPQPVFKKLCKGLWARLKSENRC